MEDEMGRRMEMRGSSTKEQIAFEQGMIEGWRHIRAICNSCIKAHIEDLKMLNRVRKSVEKKWGNK